MLLIRAIVRPEKKDEVLAELSTAGFNAATMVDVVGRGKQKGIKIGGMVYDEIPKTLILMVILTIAGIVVFWSPPCDVGSARRQHGDVAGVGWDLGTGDVDEQWSPCYLACQRERYLRSGHIQPRRTAHGLAAYNVGQGHDASVTHPNQPDIRYEHMRTLCPFPPSSLR